MRYYNTPDPHMVGGKLLDNSYENWKSHNKYNLHKEAETFGLAACGDGATVKRLPLLNALVIGVNCPPAVESVQDCTGHLRARGKKDAEYIAKQFIPIIKEHDPTGKLFDVLFFDGASNVQKAGKMLEITFP